jgi:hypothetical protein
MDVNERDRRMEATVAAGRQAQAQQGRAEIVLEAAAVPVLRAAAELCAMSADPEHGEPVRVDAAVYERLRAALMALDVAVDEAVHEALREWDWRA